MRRAHLPSTLGAAFRVSEALAVGVGRSRLEAADLDRPFHGIRVRAGERGAPSAAEARRMALQYAVRMGPQAYFIGPTAAAFWDVDVPDRIFRDGLVHVAVPAPGRAPRGRGIRGRSLDPALARSVVHPIYGVTVATPATTWALLAPWLTAPRELVAAGDAIVRDLGWRSSPPPLATLDQLRAAVEAGPRARVDALRQAVPLVRTRSASWPEVFARLILVEAGLPEPELNIEVRDDLGRWLGVPDLAYPSWKISVEYEGEHHLRDPAQWARDIDRYERFEAAGWIVVRVTKRDVLVHPGQLVARVRAALRRRGV